MIQWIFSLLRFWLSDTSRPPHSPAVRQQISPIRVARFAPKNEMSNRLCKPKLGVYSIVTSTLSSPQHDRLSFLAPGRLPYLSDARKICQVFHLVHLPSPHLAFQGSRTIVSPQTDRDCWPPVTNHMGSCICDDRSAITNCAAASDRRSMARIRFFNSHFQERWRVNRLRSDALWR